MPVWDQIAIACDIITSDPNLKDGYHGLGLSQGSQFLRLDISVILNHSKKSVRILVLEQLFKHVRNHKWSILLRLMVSIRVYLVFRAVHQIHLNFAKSWEIFWKSLINQKSKNPLFKLNTGMILHKKTYIVECHRWTLTLTFKHRPKIIFSSLRQSIMISGREHLMLKSTKRISINWKILFLLWAARIRDPQITRQVRGWTIFACSTDHF